MFAPLSPIKPRKLPQQRRSEVTVQAVFEACIQVLLDKGIERLTTTRVAARAGVSVGTLYQYFPNKEALLAAVLQHHLSGVRDAVTGIEEGVRGKSLAEIVDALINALFDAKFADPATSKALYAVVAVVGESDAVMRLTMEAQATIIRLLSTASDRSFPHVESASFILSTAVTGPVQALLDRNGSVVQIDNVRQQLKLLSLAYLRAVSTCHAVELDRA